jgi:prepilin-type N-terminal cleavage/methylation domain-containing protein
MRRNKPQVGTVEPSAGRRRAFSLIELVVVIIITGLLASIALPRFADAQTRYRLRLAGQRLVADLEMAGAAARQAGASRSVVFDTRNNAYSIADMPSFERPGEAGSAYAVDLTADPYAVNLYALEFEGDSNTLTFNGYGRADRSGSVILVSGDSSITVSINAANGEVTLP